MKIRVTCDALFCFPIYEDSFSCRTIDSQLDIESPRCLEHTSVAPGVV